MWYYFTLFFERESNVFDHLTHYNTLTFRNPEFKKARYQLISSEYKKLSYTQYPLLLHMHLEAWVHIHFLHNQQLMLGGQRHSYLTSNSLNRVFLLPQKEVGACIRLFSFSFASQSSVSAASDHLFLTFL